ncbi:MAG: hypothetical protein LKI93_04065 [Bifidobacteriaceae bacterium]|nr:hypothetical protein [Bifidobacteriaceae bacterium]MCI1914752.1 hypothetical protein [Bifidobacteriaceae bacterium]
MSDSVNNNPRAAENDREGTSQPGGSSDRSASTATGQQGTPEFGQYQEPSYGKLASQYPGWDPYIYGKPDPVKPKNEEGTPDQAAAGNAAPTPQRAGSPNGAAQNTNNPSNPSNPNGFPFEFRRIDPNDPRQNPYYGRWDGMSIIAFVVSFIFPIISIPLAWIAMRRTKLLHSKGHGLAVAAMVISLLQIVLNLILYMNGIDLMSWAMQEMGYSGSVSGGTDGSSVSTSFME